jgi:general secretion pathway protein I
MKMRRDPRFEDRELINSARRVRSSGSRLSPLNSRRRSAFTLIEVMIALGIFFMAMFAILGLVSNSLRNARALQRKTVGCGMVAAELSLTNKLTEGLETGDFGDMYPDFNWTRDIYEVETNRLFQMDMIVQRRSGGAVESKMSILLFRPESPPGSLSRGTL